MIGIDMLTNKSRNYTSPGTYRVIIRMKGSCLSIDRMNKIVKVDWKGTVDLATTKLLLTQAADLIEADEAKRLLLNRKNLTEFSKQARLWIREELLMKRAKLIVHKVEKIAAVKSSSDMGKVFAHIISTSIKVVFPRLKLVEFQSEEDARHWLIS